MEIPNCLGMPWPVCLLRVFLLLHLQNTSDQHAEDCIVTLDAEGLAFIF